MQRKSITNFEYIAILVEYIQKSAEKGDKTDFYFDELENIYVSLLKSTTNRILRHLQSKNLTSQDVYNLVRGKFYTLILRYNPEYTNKRKKEGFTTVYFSTYLRNAMEWEVYRLKNPVKPESDDLEKSLHHADLHAMIYNESAELADAATPSGVTSNFIHMCNYLRGKMQSDLHADVMFLVYAYNLKFNEVAKLLGIPPPKISKIANEVKAFWIENKDQLKE